VLWDTNTGKALRTFDQKVIVDSAATNDDCSRVVSSGYPHRAILWDGLTGEPLRAFAGHSTIVVCVAMSENGDRILTGSYDKTAILWDANTGKNLHTFRGHLEEITDVSLSTDSRRAITVSEDGTTRIWDAESGNELAALISLDEGKDWLVVTPDGRYDGSDGAERFIRYRKSGTLDFVPLEQVRDRFHRPGLLAEVWNDKGRSRGIQSSARDRSK
jgi:WD40 repeat protein